MQAEHAFIRSSRRAVKTSFGQCYNRILAIRMRLWAARRIIGMPKFQKDVCC